LIAPLFFNKTISEEDVSNSSKQSVREFLQRLDDFPDASQEQKLTDSVGKEDEQPKKFKTKLDNLFCDDSSANSMQGPTRSKKNVIMAYNDLRRFD